MDKLRTEGLIEYVSNLENVKIQLHSKKRDTEIPLLIKNKKGSVCNIKVIVGYNRGESCPFVFSAEQAIKEIKDHIASPY